MIILYLVKLYHIIIDRKEPYCLIFPTSKESTVKVCKAEEGYIDIDKLIITYCHQVLVCILY